MNHRAHALSNTQNIYIYLPTEEEKEDEEERRKRESRALCVCEQDPLQSKCAMNVNELRCFWQRL